jgi:hypothetical protein
LLDEFMHALRRAGTESIDNKTPILGRRPPQKPTAQLRTLRRALPPTRGAEVSGDLGAESVLLLVTGANGGKSACVPGWSASLSVRAAVR